VVEGQTPSHAKTSRVRHLLQVAGVALAYFGAAKLGLSLAFATQQVTAVWPPTGVALAALLLLGNRAIPGVLLGAFLANATADEPLITAAGIAMGNTATGVLGAYALRRFVGFDPALERIRDVVGLMATALGSTTVSASLGVANLAVGGIVPWSAYGSVWWVWWVGDTLGIWLVAPLLLTIGARGLPRRTVAQHAEFVVLLGALLVVCTGVFSASFGAIALGQLKYLVFPLFVWTALRFGQRETVTAALVVAGIAVWATTHDVGPFAVGTLDDRLIQLDTFVAMTGGTSLLLGAATTERQQALERLRKEHERLEERVGERTADLARASAQLTREKGLLAAILESIDEGVVAVDTSLRMLSINAVARKMVGATYPRDHVPADWREHIRVTYEDGSAMEPDEGPLVRAARGEVTEGLVYRIGPPGGNDGPTGPGVWVSATARPIRDEAGGVVAAVATLRDITAQREEAAKLRGQSLTDELTGLLNRRGFSQLAGARMAEGRRRAAPMALLFADMNGLKRINDELGHDQGDHAIEDAARALRSVVRAGDLLARLGGDEFVALLPDFDPRARDAFLERLAGAIRDHEREPRPFRLSVSYDMTFMDWESGQSLEDLLADADRKMYARKRERDTTSAPVVRAPPSA